MTVTAFAKYLSNHLYLQGIFLAYASVPHCNPHKILDWNNQNKNNSDGFG